MKKVIILFIFSLSLLVANAQKYVTTQDVNVRKGASAQFDILGIIHNGEKVEILETDESWGKILFQGNYGYINTKYLTPDSDNTITDNTNTPQKQSSKSMLTYFIVFIIILVLVRNVQPFKLIFSIIGKILKISLSDSKTRELNIGASC